MRYRRNLMPQAVVCLVSDTMEAESVINNLRSAGFHNSDISLLMPDKGNVRDLGLEKHSKAPEGATAGVSTGAIVGGALGWLAGMGALTIPGLGPFLAAGPIMLGLSGAAVGGAVGGVGGALIGLGIPEMEAKLYEGKIREGNILISVHCENQQETRRAQDVVKTLHAHDIARMHESPFREHGSHR